MKNVAGKMLVSIMPYLKEIKKRWPDFDISDVEIKLIHTNIFNIPYIKNPFVRWLEYNEIHPDPMETEVLEIQLEKLAGNQGAMRVFYEERGKTLFLRA